ncbi:MAG: DUF1800 domain-containing protein [Nocardioides sp.]
MTGQRERTASRRRSSAGAPADFVDPSRTGKPEPRGAGSGSWASGSVQVKPRLLAGRASYGPTAELMADIRELGVEGWLARQLDPASIPDPNGDAIDRAFPSAMAAPADVIKRQGAKGVAVRSEVPARHLMRAVWSSRQLHEVMIDFWSNHLNVNADTSAYISLARPHYDAVIREHALGSYRDLLRESGLHPAMLNYLGNGESVKEHPNENYGRELLELHTVGVGNHSERDVIRCAKLLTGWSARISDGLAVRYNPDDHYVGELEVLGRRFANASDSAGPAMWVELVDFLVLHPDTARMIAKKLARHFIVDDPSEEIIADLAKTYLESDTNIPAVLRRLFSSSEFARSKGMKFRRPYERFVSIVRLLAPKLPNNPREAGLALYNSLDSQPPLCWPAPNGYADVAGAWLSPGASLGLFNAGLRQVRGQPPVVGFDAVARILSKDPTTVEQVTELAAEVVLLRKPKKKQKAAVAVLLEQTAVKQPFKSGSIQQRRAVELACTLLLVSPKNLVT